MSTPITQHATSQYATSTTLYGSDEELYYPADYTPFSTLCLRDDQEAQQPAYPWPTHGLPTAAQLEQDEDDFKYPPDVLEQMDDTEL